jgi:glycosyltransferase involved in cell wall biosynthesis
MRILMITPKVDPGDDLFGHVNSWAAALATRVERLYVVALWGGRPMLPANARFATLGKDPAVGGTGSLSSRLGWLVRLQRIVARLCLRDNVDAVLAHMGPVFAVAAAPIARISGRPTFLWYAHGHVSSMLRLAHQLVDGVGTSTPEGFRITSPKITITGQGIDLNRFRPASSGPTTERLLSVGRFSPVKQYETVIDALVDPSLTRYSELELELVGGIHSGAEAEYLSGLESRASSAGVAGRVRFVRGLPHAEIVPTYQRSSLFATASVTGSLDKVVLEAAACGLAPLVCNPAFRELFGDQWDGLSFGPHRDVAGLADRIAASLDRSPTERRSSALEIRAKIERSHSVDHWADAVVEMIERGVDRRR